MNEKSLICNYIKNHPDTWENDIKKMKIRFNKDADNLCIFKYDVGADFSDPIVCEARGIIIDLNNLEVVGIGFNKFFNSHEEYAADIDWHSARVQEKLDGSILKLFYNPYRNQWQWATNGVIEAVNATCEDFIHKNFQELVNSADNLGCLDFNILNKDKSYIFEIVDPSLHVVKYDSVHLFHIGTRNNKTLEETIDDIGIEKPIEYNLHTLEECIKFVETLNKDNVAEHEGFVVVDKNWNRIKVKNSLYLQLHYMENIVLTKSKMLELLFQDDIDPFKLMEDFPKNKPCILWYLYQVARVEQEIDEFIRYVRTTYKNNGGNRKDIAEKIKNHKYSSLGFRAINNEKTAKELFAELVPASKERLIEDYPV